MEDFEYDLLVTGRSVRISFSSIGVVVGVGIGIGVVVCVLAGVVRLRLPLVVVVAGRSISISIVVCVLAIVMGVSLVVTGRSVSSIRISSIGIVVAHGVVGVVVGVLSIVMTGHNHGRGRGGEN
ncbi:hypothetical protein F4820DRAFT_428493 [Hypoxylon rubiginosum]|uniref:Uncharacterized protein n=1 Tax=Hypoxylon rubiginosum TaxID=110542 RepID=A0ACB9YUM7_9PEZI|nr:hypothetical protein F4820DRAFT_428493 [Hypoxylon rubiginosum]